MRRNTENQYARKLFIKPGVQSHIALKLAEIAFVKNSNHTDCRGRNPLLEFVLDSLILEVFTFEGTLGTLTEIARDRNKKAPLRNT